MSVVVRYPVTIRNEDRDAVDEILTQFYQRGELDSVTVESIMIDCELKNKLWLECGMDDFIAIKNELNNRGVMFT